MPRFEYKCSDDGRTLEETVASYDDTVSCPDCGRAMDKQFTKAPMVLFGRSGGASLVDVYERDFRQMELDGEL